MRIILHNICQETFYSRCHTVETIIITIIITHRWVIVGQLEQLGIAFWVNWSWADFWKLRRNQRGSKKQRIHPGQRKEHVCCGRAWIFLASNSVWLQQSKSYPLELVRGQEDGGASEGVRGPRSAASPSLCAYWAEGPSVFSWPRNQGFFHVEEHLRSCPFSQPHFQTLKTVANKRKTKLYLSVCFSL